MNSKNWFFVAGGALALWLYTMGQSWIGKWATGFMVLAGSPTWDIPETLHNIALLVTIILGTISGFSIFMAIKNQKIISFRR